MAITGIARAKEWFMMYQSSEAILLLEPRA